MNAHATIAGAPTGTPVGSGETKHQKFIRLAEARVSRTLEDLRLVNQLSARTYEHKPAEAETIIKTLADALAETAKTFAIPFVFRAGRAGKADPSNSIFEEPKNTTLAETNKTKLAIAKALDHLAGGSPEQIEEAKTILANLL